MASQHIEVTGSESRTAAKLRACIDGTRRAVDDMDRLKDTLDQTASGGDWTALRVSLGGGVTEAESETIYNLLTAAMAALKAADVALFTDRLG